MHARNQAVHSNHRDAQDLTGEDGHGGVDQVGDDGHEGLGAVLGHRVGEARVQRRVHLEEVLPRHPRLAWNARRDHLRARAR